MFVYILSLISKLYYIHQESFKEFKLHNLSLSLEPLSELHLWFYCPNVSFVKLVYLQFIYFLIFYIFDTFNALI